MIEYNDDKRIFTIHTKNSTYQMQADGFGYLLHLYYGRRTLGVTDWALSYVERGFSVNPYDAGNDRTYSLDVLPQEFPSQGTGDFRSTMLNVHDESGTYGCELRYVGYEILTGKYSLSGLPAVYANDNDEAGTLIITLSNERLGLTAKLLYGVLPEKDIITRSAIITNDGKNPFTLTKLLTSCIDFTHGDFDLITFHGRHAMERNFERTHLTHGLFTIGSRRGMSSHQYNPFMILCEHNATETSGNCWGMQFVYSGGFRAEAELDQYGQTRLMMGLAEEKFSYTLKPGESITAPEVIMTFSSQGLEKLTHNFHDCLRKNICRGKFRDIQRPIVLNSWEALYFDFCGEKIIDMAKCAKSLGVDMFVLDDGWFVGRNDDNHALGDWTEDTEKLGGTLGELVGKINAMGLSFGLWVEPEMISENSRLYREHPEWAMSIPGENPVRGRGQLVLDLSRHDVREYVYRSIAKILDGANVEYLKWDYNRSINEVYSHSSQCQGKIIYDYMLGLYEVLERINTNYPDVLIEGCAGGGGRFDAGMLYYTPQIWTSDNTDALDRMSIHYGTSFGYPVSAMAAHVSVCPNHQTGRITPLNTRYVVSMSGAFGYELDPVKLTDDEKNEIRRQIQSYKNDREIITDGLYYRLSHEDFFAWEHVSRDGSRALISVVVPLNHGNMPMCYVMPRGLTPGAFYRDCDSGKVYPSDALMFSGLPLGILTGDFRAFTFRLERVE